MRAIVAAILLAVAPQHDTVFMGDGGRVVGTVVEEGPQGVSVQLLDGTVRRYPSRDVLRVEYADGTVSSLRAPTAATVAQPPVQQPPAPAPQQAAPPAAVVIQVPAYAPPPAAVPQQYAPPAPSPQAPPAQPCGPAPCAPQQNMPAPQSAPPPAPPSQYSPPPQYAPPPQYPPPQYAPPPQYPPPQYAPPKPYPPRPQYRQYAPPRYPPYPPESRPGRAPISPVYAVFGLGGLVISGNVEEGVSTDRLYEPQLGLWLETGLRLSPEVAIGGYLGLGFGDAAPELRDACTASGMTCTTATGRLGILLRRTFDPLGRTAPWIAAGTGFEFGSAMSDDTGSSSSEQFTYSGWEALRLMVGVDHRASPVLGVGLYGGIAWGRYSRYEDAGGTVDLGGQPFHTTAEAGLRFTLFP
jgi:hypothetical protein